MTSSNPMLRRAAVMLERAGKAGKARIWAEASRMLSRPGLTKVEINVGRLSRIAAPGEALLVPGKVLGGGIIDNKVVVGAFLFSGAAKAKISAAGGSAVTLEQLLKKFPKGSGVRLVE
ncbi:MAG: 50S ribosomal protein L18e [Thaumarchaeota archaeon]|nr:50S ribosomal protein L18e [Nitrososphaerota archaeon]